MNTQHTKKELIEERTRLVLKLQSDDGTVDDANQLACVNQALAEIARAASHPDTYGVISC